MTSSWLQRLDDHWFGPVPAWPLASFRIAFTTVLILYYTDRLLHLQELFGDSPARLPDLAMDEASQYFFVQSIHWGALPDTIAVGLAVVFYAAAFGLLLGRFARTSAAVLALWMTFRLIFDWPSGFSIDRSSVLVLTILAASPCARVLSLDARRDSQPLTQVRISAWGTRTLQWLLMSWYVMSGIAKLSGAWSLSDPDPVLYSQLQGWYQNDLAFWALTHLPQTFFLVLQQVSLLFELYAPLLLIPNRIRPFGMLIGIGMHVSVAATMLKLWYFSAEMLCFYLLFLPLHRSRRAPG